MTSGSLKNKHIEDHVRYVVPRLWRRSKAETETFESLDCELLGFGVYVSRKAGELIVELDGKPYATFSFQEIDDQVEKTITHDGKSAIISFEWTDPEDEPHELMELIHGIFYGEDDFSLRSAIHTVAEILEEHGIDPIGEEGREVFDVFMDNVDFEMYDDFYRFDSCLKCGASFKPECDVEYVQQVLAEKVLCAKCTEKLVKDL